MYARRVITLQALRDTPALLKLDLYCKGVRLDDTCYVTDNVGYRHEILMVDAFFHSRLLDLK